MSYEYSHAAPRKGVYSTARAQRRASKELFAGGHSRGGSAPGQKYVPGEYFRLVEQAVNMHPIPKAPAAWWIFVAKERLGVPQLDSSQKRDLKHLVSLVVGHTCRQAAENLEAPKPARACKHYDALRQALLQALMPPAPLPYWERVVRGHLKSHGKGYDKKTGEDLVHLFLKSSEQRKKLLAIWKEPPGARRKTTFEKNSSKTAKAVMAVVEGEAERRRKGQRIVSFASQLADKGFFVPRDSVRLILAMSRGGKQPHFLPLLSKKS